MSDFEHYVSTRYQLYNSLFLNLPYSEIYRTGTLLPLLQQACEDGFANRKDPEYIINRFFREFTSAETDTEKFDLLFKFIQYTERQVVLFDSVEDASFEHLNDLKGKGTVSGLLLRANAQGVVGDLKQKLDSLSVRIVLTAHPTQFYPGSVLGIITDLEQAIRGNEFERINLLLQQLSKTAFINKEKPSPFDEAVSLCWYLESVFYHSIPAIIIKLVKGLGLTIEEWKNMDLIKIGFWPGGDRDGNPFVTHDITVRVAKRLQETLMKCYHRDLRILRRRLTFRKVDHLIENIERKIYSQAYEKGSREEYQHAGELLNDLYKVRGILIEDHKSLFLDLLDEVILKVKIFGLYFASMDIRQDSRKHAQVWEVILKQLSGSNKELKKFDALPEAEQVKGILNLKVNLDTVRLSDEFSQELLDSIKVIKEVQSKNGEEGCHRYVISNCRSALDVIRVYQLAKLILGKKDVLPLDIVPLFETIEDLQHAPAVMASLYKIPAYRKHLKNRGNKQVIMLGFSDGTKDGGYLKANWSIFRAKEKLTAVSRENGFLAVFFDGRGGPPARGGGNTHDFYASLGDTIEDREIQITIQGQTISSNFGNSIAATYNLEQLISAGIDNSVFHPKKNQLTEADRDLLEDLASEGYQAYLDLKNDPSFVPYLEKVTPLHYFSHINIGSRPVKRNSSGGLNFADLRAIPFVGSWAQMKQNIPGFYGVGTALHALKKRKQLSKLMELYERSLFFRTLLNNTMMSLTKSFYPATAYLSKDKEFSAFWKKMHNEFILTTRMVLETTGQKELMESNPLNRDSVRLRERIVLPLICIQQYALQQLRMRRPEPQQKAAFEKLVLRCMFGIVNAARNSA